MAQSKNYNVSQVPPKVDANSATITDLSARVNTAEGNVSNLSTRTTTNENNIGALTPRVTTLENKTSNINNTSDANKPISTATQTALNGKISTGGGQITGPIWGNTYPNNSWGTRAWFQAYANPGAYTNTFTRAGGYSSYAAQTNNVYTPHYRMDYANVNSLNQTFSGVYTLGTLRFSGDGGNNPGEMVIQHIDASGNNQYLWYFSGTDGTFRSPGTISAPAKNFIIDHPADPLGYDMVHCAVESPRMEVTYTGTVKLENGKATVNVEEYFGVMRGGFTNLWKDAWVVSLQNQDSFSRLKPSRVTDATFEITCEDTTSNDLVTWVLNARRYDAYVRWDGCTQTDSDGNLIIEIEKPE